MWFGVAALVLTGVALFGLRLRNRLRSGRQDQPSLESNSLRKTEIAKLEKFMYASTHYEMREAVDASLLFGSQQLDEILKNHLFLMPAEYHATILYKLRWLENGYPGPSPEVCEMNRAAGADRRFISIGAGLKIDKDKPDHERLQWAAEIEGAFLRAETLDAIREVAMHYPILLNPFIQGGIDATLMHSLSETERRACREKLRYLERLREEIEGQPVESWWRPIVRQYGGPFWEDPTA